MYGKELLLGLLLACGLAALWNSQAFATDCNQNGVDDLIDIASQVSADCNENLIPDECDADDGSRVLYTWGRGSSGTPIPQGRDLRVVAGGDGFGVGLWASGSIAVWGDTSTYKLSPPPTGTDFVSVDGGTMHALALRSDGRIVGWGSSALGRLPVPSGSNYKAISAGFDHSLALRTDGTIVAWGNNAYGQCSVPSGTTYVAVAAGESFSLALKADGTIIGWGLNTYGQTTPPAGNNCVAIDAGRRHGVALRSDGSIAAWGYNASGQTNVPPGNDFIAVAAGTSQNLALRRDGTLVGWGGGSYGISVPPAGNAYTAIACGGYDSITLRRKTPLAGDCNDNHVLDSCEITANVVSDCDGTGVPDSCEAIKASGELMASSPAGMAYFGKDIAFSDDGLLVGMPSIDSGRAGTVIFYKEVGGVWTETQTLAGTSGFAYSSYGQAVALDGDTAVVGAPLDRGTVTLAGSAHVYRYDGSTWNLETMLSLPEAASSDRFGQALAISGDNVVVGAWGRDDAGTDAGAAYAFHREGSEWTRTQRLTGSDTAASHAFGSSAYMAGALLIVGAPGNSQLGTNAGAAYVFRQEASGWVQESKLVASNGSASDRFGSAVWIGNDLAFVGAPKAGSTGAENGSVYVFHRTNDVWQEEAIIVPPASGGASAFGSCVRLLGNLAVITAPEDNEVASYGGAVYVFAGQVSRWTQVLKLPDIYPGKKYGQFGSSIACRNRLLAVGIPSFSSSASYEGRVNLFTLPDLDFDAVPDTCEDCDGNGIEDADELAGNPSLDCNVNGRLDVCDAIPAVYTFTRQNAVAEERFGSSVAVDGQMAVVGATNQGRAYVLGWNGTEWLQNAELVPWNTTGTVKCVAVALQGDTAVLTARWYPGDGTHSAAAYVFRRNGDSWLPQSQLLPWDLPAGEDYGESVAIDGDLIAVSAVLWDDNWTTTPGRGAGYVYRNNGTGWVSEARLAPPGPGWYATGQRVAISGNSVLLAGSQARQGEISCGAVYSFHYDGSSWLYEQAIVPTDPSLLGFFGKDVAIRGNTAVIGATGDDQQANSAGALYVFENNGSGWVQTAKLTDPRASAYDQLGAAVAFDGRTIAAAATGTRFRCLFHQQQGVWTLDQNVLVDNAAQVADVAVQGAIIVAGSPFDDQVAQNAGKLYSVHLTDADYDGLLNECDMCPNTPPGRITAPNGCGLPMADFDEDGDVDGDDLEVLFGCGSGPDVLANAGCSRADLDGDGDIDMVDFARFQRCLSLGQSADPDCAE